MKKILSLLIASALISTSANVAVLAGGGMSCPITEEVTPLSIEEIRTTQETALEILRAQYHETVTRRHASYEDPRLFCTSGWSKRYPTFKIDGTVHRCSAYSIADPAWLCIYYINTETPDTITSLLPAPKFILIYKTMLLTITELAKVLQDKYPVLAGPGYPTLRSERYKYCRDVYDRVLNNLLNNNGAHDTDETLTRFIEEYRLFDQLREKYGDITDESLTNKSLENYFLIIENRSNGPQDPQFHVQLLNHRELYGK